MIFQLLAIAVKLIQKAGKSETEKVVHQNRENTSTCSHCKHKSPAFISRCSNCYEAMCSNCGRFSTGEPSHYDYWCNNNKASIEQYSKTYV